MNYTKPMEICRVIQKLSKDYSINLSQLHEIGVTQDKEWKPKGMYDIREELKEREE